jgi:cytochrome P450
LVKRGEVVDVLGRLRSAACLVDPYPFYADLRERRVVRARDGAVVLARHADVVAVLSDRRFGKLPTPKAPLRAARVLFRMFLLLDPPDHTRLRRVVAPAFTVSAIAVLRERITSLTGGLLPPAGGTVELMEDFAYALPITVISELLGIAAADQPRLARWSRLLTESIDDPPPTKLRELPQAIRDVLGRRSHPVAATRAAQQMVGYVEGQLTKANESPATELLSLLSDGLGQRELDRDEALATWIMLAIAGHETTANLIGNSMFALIEHVDVLQRLATDASLIPSAVEECVRFDTPVPYTARIALQPVEIAGLTIEQAQTVLLMMAAANRDSDAFPDADVLDIDRPKTPNHLGFAHGIHFCLGAALARLETEIALATILPRLATDQDPGQAERRATVAVRGLATLPVNLIQRRALEHA